MSSLQPPPVSQLVICSTCRSPSLAATASESTSCGAGLLAQAAALMGDNAAYAHVQVVPIACLWACAHACAVHIRAPGKTGYIAGRFEPGRDAAEAILDFAAAHARSDDGAVPYRQWPEGVKGHFIARIPDPEYAA